MIEEAFGWPKERRNQSYAALPAVLHALRDRLTVDEVAHLAAQLPMLIRDICYDGWDPSRVPQTMSANEFLIRVRADFPFSTDTTTEELVHRDRRAPAAPQRRRVAPRDDQPAQGIHVCARPSVRLTRLRTPLRRVPRRS